MEQPDSPTTAPPRPDEVQVGRGDTAVVSDPTSAEITRGFLFADLRGYTQLVDNRGAVEATGLLGRYRTITREVVGRHGGAEIKTEGDSFYVVLPSASAAVRCGLALVEACRTPPDGSEPIPVGIGIHAGEAVAHEGGFVGSAVNIASRICAVARPGELLASATVRDLTRSMGSARFVPIGRRQLKGLEEPIELVRVLPEGAVEPTVRRRGRSTALPARGWLMGGGVAVAIVALGLLIAAVQGGLGLTAAGPTASLAASASPVAGPSASIARLPLVQSEFLQVEVNPGLYAPNVNPDVASVTVPAFGWLLIVDREDLLAFAREGEGVVRIGRVAVVYSGPCPEDGTRAIGERPQDLIEWIQAAPQLDASAPRSVNDLGLSGIAIEATVRSGLGNCAGRAPGVSIWQAAGGSWKSAPGSAIRIEALNDRDRTLTVVYAAGNPDSLAQFVNGPARRLLDSVTLR